MTTPRMQSAPFSQAEAASWPTVSFMTATTRVAAVAGLRRSADSRRATTSWWRQSGTLNPLVHQRRRAERMLVSSQG